MSNRMYQNTVVALVVVVTLGYVLTGRAEAQAAPAFATPPVFSAGGLASVVFNGGTVDQLEAAAESAGASGAWLQDPSGAFQLLVIGGPAFLKDAFRKKMPASLPPVAITLSGGRPGMAPAAAPTPSTAPAPTSTPRPMTAPAAVPPAPPQESPPDDSPAPPAPPPTY